MVVTGINPLSNEHLNKQAGQIFLIFTRIVCALLESVEVLWQSPRESVKLQKINLASFESSHKHETMSIMGVAQINLVV